MSQSWRVTAGAVVSLFEEANGAWCGTALRLEHNYIVACTRCVVEAGLAGRLLGIRVGGGKDSLDLVASYPCDDTIFLKGRLYA